MTPLPSEIETLLALYSMHATPVYDGNRRTVLYWRVLRKRTVPDYPVIIAGSNVLIIGPDATRAHWVRELEVFSNGT